MRGTQVRSSYARKVSWVQDLGSPTRPGSHQYLGVPLVVKGDDIARAKEEMAKGLSDVVFNLVLIKKE
jgi:hypothetical protein